MQSLTRVMIAALVPVTKPIATVIDLVVPVFADLKPPPCVNSVLIGEPSDSV